MLNLIPMYNQIFIHQSELKDTHTPHIQFLAKLSWWHNLLWLVEGCPHMNPPSPLHQLQLAT